MPSIFGLQHGTSGFEMILRVGFSALAGLMCVVALAWLTTWAFAVFCFGILSAGFAAQQARGARPWELPLWMSSGGGTLFLQLVSLLGVVLPLLVGVVAFRWWWGLVAYPLATLGAGLTSAIAPGVVRLLIGLLLCAGTALVAWLT